MKSWYVKRNSRWGDEFYEVLERSTDGSADRQIVPGLLKSDADEIVKAHNNGENEGVDRVVCHSPLPWYLSHSKKAIYDSDGRVVLEVEGNSATRIFKNLSLIVAAVNSTKERMPWYW